MKRVLPWFLLAFVACYMCAYGVVRTTGIIVHYRTYSTDATGRLVYEHAIDVGGLRDHSMPVLPPSSLPKKVFKPLCWIELHAWKVLQPNER